MDRKRPTVAVLGGGIGGLSAAHELVERGADVTIYEAADALGGKARSVRAGPGDGLPAEHGFRFFPGFYRNLRDTMKRTPLPGGGSVADNLVPTTETLVTSVAGRETVSATNTPTTLAELADSLRPTIGGGELSAAETGYFVRRLLALLTSGRKRRERELDRITWWEFVDAEARSPAYRKHLAESTQALVALRPQRASARTIGQIYVQLMLDQIDPERPTEAVLDGPTSEVWIEPWERYLRTEGVTVLTGRTVTAIGSDGERVTGATVEGPDGEETVTADFYVAALPVEVMAGLLTPELERAAPSLSGIPNLDTAWMNGLQFYLTEDAPLAHGHQAYTDSPWALTAISQRQFWEDGPVDVDGFAGGEVAGVLSVIISDWNTPGVVHGKPARECTRGEIREEVWTQLTAHLNRGRERLTEDMVYDWALDPSIVEGEGGLENRQPLLINTADSLRHRPRAVTEAPNLVLAADYVRTGTDLATMESANEAARRAVAGIVRRAGLDADAPAAWGLSEPRFLDPLKRQDDLAFSLGAPHPGEVERGLRGAFRRLRSRAGV